MGENLQGGAVRLTLDADDRMMRGILRLLKIDLEPAQFKTGLTELQGVLKCAGTSECVLGVLKDTLNKAMNSDVLVNVACRAKQEIQNMFGREAFLGIRAGLQFAQSYTEFLVRVNTNSNTYKGVFRAGFLQFAQRYTEILVMNLPISTITDSDCKFSKKIEKKIPQK
jgi:hypothetical protein